MYVNFPAIMPYYEICDLFYEVCVHAADLRLSKTRANIFQGAQSDFFNEHVNLFLKIR